MTSLQRIQEAVAARIRSCPNFEHADIVVVTSTSAAKRESVMDQINKSLAGVRKINGRAGLAIIIPRPELKAKEPNLPGPQLSLSVPVQIVENTQVNRGDGGTGLTEEEAALLLLALIGDAWQARPWLTFLAAEDAREDLELDERTSGDVGSQVNFQVELAVNPFPRVSRPEFSLDDDGRLVMTCATEGATIHYTLDESTPWPGGESSAVYEAPLLIEPGQTILAAAYRAADTPGDLLAGSDVNEFLT